MPLFGQVKSCLLDSKSQVFLKGSVHKSHSEDSVTTTMVEDSLVSSGN